MWASWLICDELLAEWILCSTHESESQYPFRVVTVNLVPPPLILKISTSFYAAGIAAVSVMSRCEDKEHNAHTPIEEDKSAATCAEDCIRWQLKVDE